MAITATASILTGDDWKLAKDIKPGDWVFNRFGKPVKVKVAQMFRSEDCYRVTFDDYLIVEGDRHLAFDTENQQFRIGVSAYKGHFKFKRPLKRKTVVDILEEGVLFRGNRMAHSVQTTAPIELPHQPLGIPPFVYGFWFASRKRKLILTAPFEFADRIYEKFKESGYKIEKLGVQGKKYEKFRTEPSVWDQLRGHQTHKIPLAYLNGSAEQRLDLLQGILCAKPVKKIDKVQSFLIKLVNKALSTAIQYLAESLGAQTKLSLDPINKTNNLKIYRNPPFLPEQGTARPFVSYARRYVKSIQPTQAQLCVHIETDDSDGSYLVGEGFIPCH